MKLVIDGTGLDFIKSSRSHIDGKECLYVAADGDQVHLVESEDKSTVLHTTRAKFAAFVDGVQKGEFDFAI